MMVLMKRLSITNRGMYVNRLWITDASKLPPKYFLRESVLKAVQKEALKDVRNAQTKRIPAGCQVRLVKKPLLRHVWDLIRGRK